MPDVDVVTQRYARLDEDVALTWEAVPGAMRYGLIVGLPDLPLPPLDAIMTGATREFALVGIPPEFTGAVDRGSPVGEERQYGLVAYRRDGSIAAAPDLRFCAAASAPTDRAYYSFQPPLLDRPTPPPDPVAADDLAPALELPGAPAAAGDGAGGDPPSTVTRMEGDPWDVLAPPSPDTAPLNAPPLDAPDVSPERAEPAMAADVAPPDATPPLDAASPAAEPPVESPEAGASPNAGTSDGSDGDGSPGVFPIPDAPGTAMAAPEPDGEPVALAAPAGEAVALAALAPGSAAEPAPGADPIAVAVPVFWPAAPTPRAAPVAALLDEAELSQLPRWADHAAAARLLDQATALAPDDARVQALRSRLQDAPDAAGDDVDALAREANRCLERHDYWGAVTLYERILARQPDHAEARRAVEQARQMGQWTARMAGATGDAARLRHIGDDLATHVPALAGRSYAASFAARPDVETLRAWLQMLARAGQAGTAAEARRGVEALWRSGAVAPDPAQEQALSALDDAERAGAAPSALDPAIDALVTALTTGGRDG